MTSNISWKTFKMTDGRPACDGMTEQFFIVTTVGRAGPKKTAQRLAVQNAKDICATCQYQQVCLETAVKRNEYIGIWGGVDFYNRQEKKEAMENARRTSTTV